MNITKDDVVKVLGGLFVLVLILSSVGVENETVSAISSGLAVLIVIAAIALLGERATQLVKIVARYAFGNIAWLKFLQPSGAGSIVLSFIVAFAGLQSFDVSLFDQFEVFNNIDSNLVEAITLALIWIGSNIWHESLPEDVIKAPQVK